MIFKKWLIDRFFVVFFVWGSFFLVQTCFSHEGHDASPEEVQSAYLALLNSIESSVTRNALNVQNDIKIPFVYYGNGSEQIAGDAVSALVLEALRQTKSDEVFLHHHDGDEQNFFQKWRIGLNRFVLTMPSLFVQGFKQYGIPYAIYTLITETVEHIFIPHPAFCKILQGAYFASAGIVANFCRVEGDPQLVQKNIAFRVKAAFLAAKNEFVFKYFSKNKIRFAESLNASTLKQKDFEKYLDLKFYEMGYLIEMLSTSLFWSDLVFELSNEDFTKSKEERLPGTLFEQFSGDLQKNTPRARQWHAYRVAAFLELFADLIQELWDTQMTEQLMEGSLQGREYWKYLKIKGVLGELGRAVDIYKSQLLANASLSETVENSNVVEALYLALKNELIPLLRRSVVLLDQDISDLSLAELKKLIKQSTHLIKQSHKEACAKYLLPKV